ncbi:MAG TPA: ATP synthase F1 subunit delta [Thermoanaerobaculia bacterium]|nr:ATP synthase F1 subunit delta [Thermoanaerobaculia bacterium]
MSTATDTQLAVASVYSRALLALARERGEEDALLDELTQVADYLARTPAFIDFLGSPLVDGDARQQVIEKAFRGRASDLLVDGLQVLNRKERLGLLAAVAQAYRSQHRELKGIVDVHVRTAVPLSPALRQQLEAAARHFTGRTPLLIEQVDPALVGGLVVQVGDRKMDSSIASRLHEISRRFDERGSQEIYRGAAYVSPGEPAASASAP